MKKNATLRHEGFSVGIVGVGNIGGLVAHGLLQRGVSRVMLYDIQHDRALGKAKDLSQAAALGDFPEYRVHAVRSCEELTACDLIVITAGKPRLPGMNRQDLLQLNQEVLASFAPDLMSSAALFLMVTNPVDVLSHWWLQRLSLPRNRIFGLSGVLDSGRFKALLAEALHLSPRSIQACVIGHHTDAMIPLRSSLRVHGFPVSSDMLSLETYRSIVHATRHGGAELVNLLGTGSACYGPAEAVLTMIEAVVRDEKRVLPCSVYLDGEYTVKEAFCGVPVVLGRSGVERIVSFPMDEEEASLFSQAVSSA